MPHGLHSLSPGPVTVSNEPAFNPKLAKKDAHELQESFETTLRGEAEDGDSEGDEGDNSVCDNLAVLAKHAERSSNLH
jgi:hypothetical protein